MAEIKISCPHHARAGMAATAAKGLQWRYFGLNEFNEGSLKSAVKRFGAPGEACVPGDLNRTASQIRQDFLNWMARFGLKQEDRAAWWGSVLSSRNPMQSDFFAYCCLAESARAWMESATAQGPRFLVIEDVFLFEMLRRRFEGLNGIIFCGGHGLRRLLQAAFWAARGLVSRTRFLFQSFAITAFVKAGAPSMSRSLRDWAKASALVFTWIEQRCFNEDGKLSDPYSGRLDEILKKNGVAFVRFTFLNIPVRYSWRLRKFSSQVILTQSFVAFWDILRSAFTRFRLSGGGADMQWRGWDLRPILYRETLRERGFAAFVTYRLWYLTMRRLSRTLGGPIRSLFYPFENQPWERLLCMAWREQAPSTRLVGHQHSSIADGMLNYSLGANESDSLPLPDFVIANSAYNLDLLLRSGFPQERTLQGGALRYEHLAASTGGRSLRSPSANGKAESSGCAVLVALPYAGRYAVRLMSDLVDEFALPLVTDPRGGLPVAFKVKCHPWFPPEAFLGKRPKLPPWFSFLRGTSIESALENADLMLYVPPTTIWLDAFAAGIPILKYQSDLLDIDSSGALGGGVIHTCTRSSLRSSLEQLLRTRAVASLPERRMLNFIVGEVDDGVWARLAYGG